MPTEQFYLSAYSKADYAAKASLLKVLDPSPVSTVAVEQLKFWERWRALKYHHETFLVEIGGQPSTLGSYGEWLEWYEPGRYPVEPNIHPAFSHHRQMHHTVAQYGRALCRT